MQTKKYKLMSFLKDKILFLSVTLQQKKFFQSVKIISNVWGGVNMYKKMEICNCKVEADDQVGFLFRYYLLEDSKKIFINESHVNVPCYGIEITSERFVNGRLKEIFSDSICVVSSIKDKVINLIEFLKENQVSPLHLMDIVGEYADEWVGDFEKDAKCLMESISLI